MGGADKPIGPRPVRDEGIPIIIGGNFPGCFDRIVKWGAGWTAGGGAPTMVNPVAAPRPVIGRKLIAPADSTPGNWLSRLTAS